MHAYVTDSNERLRVTIAIAAIAVALAWLLGFTLKNVGLQPPWWLDTPSVLGFYSILHGIFDRWTWRWFSKHALVSVPDLTGTWQGELHTSHDELRQARAITATIHQTWTRMLVTLSTEHSRSNSLISGFVMDDPAAPILVYQFRNEPRATAVASMHTHRGTATLRLTRGDDSLTLSGDYYTSRDRTNFGEIVLRRTG